MKKGDRVKVMGLRTRKGKEWNSLRTDESRERSRRSRMAWLLQHSEETAPLPRFPEVHEEPVRQPELMALQDRLLARFGRHTGVKPPPFVRELRTLRLPHAMEICAGCDSIKDIDFECTNCNAGEPVLYR